MCIQIKAFFSFFFFWGIVIITDSFDVLGLKKALNRAVLQTANLSKVAKRRRGRRKKEMRRGKEENEEREEEDGERWWRKRSVRKRPDLWRDGGRGGQKWENE